MPNLAGYNGHHNGHHEPQTLLEAIAVRWLGRVGSIFSIAQARACLCLPGFPVSTVTREWRPREHTVPHRCLESPANYINEMPPRRLRTSLGSSLPRRGGRAAVPDRPEIRIRFELEARG